jgi:hypothetical protein
MSKSFTAKDAEDGKQLDRNPEGRKVIAKDRVTRRTLYAALGATSRT